MIEHNGQKDLDPLIQILIRNNSDLQSTGDPELDLLQLEERGILVIHAAGAVALEKTQRELMPV